MTEVRVTRSEISTPTPDDPERKVVQVIYQAGELPPRFLYIAKAKYTEELEAKMIREDMKGREITPPKTIEV